MNFTDFLGLTLSDTCHSFLCEAVLAEGLQPRNLEWLLLGIRHFSAPEFGYPPLLTRALYHFSECVMTDYLDGRTDTILELIWVVQHVQRFVDTESGASLGAAPDNDPLDYPAQIDLLALVNGAIVRRLGHLTILAQLAAAAKPRPDPGPDDGGV